MFASNTVRSHFTCSQVISIYITSVACTYLVYLVMDAVQPSTISHIVLAVVLYLIYGCTYQFLVPTNMFTWGLSFKTLFCWQMVLFPIIYSIELVFSNNRLRLAFGIANTYLVLDIFIYYWMYQKIAALIEKDPTARDTAILHTVCCLSCIV